MNQYFSLFVSTKQFVETFKTWKDLAMVASLGFHVHCGVHALKWQQLLWSFVTGVLLRRCLKAATLRNVLFPTTVWFLSVTDHVLVTAL